MIAMLIWGHVSKNGHNYKFGFPLIILYILLLPFYCIAFVLYLLFLIFGENTNEIVSYLKIFLNAPSLFFALKGLSIDIENEEQNIKIYIK